MHNAEFKAKVGLEAVRGVKTVAEIAQEYGVHPVLVGQWTKEILENAGALFDVKRAEAGGRKQPRGQAVQRDRQAEDAGGLAQKKLGE